MTDLTFPVKRQKRWGTRLAASSMSFPLLQLPDIVLDAILKELQGPVLNKVHLQYMRVFDQKCKQICSLYLEELWLKYSCHSL